MSRNGLNYLREDQFIELAQNGSAQDDYGITHDYVEGDLYATEDGRGTSGESGGKLYRHVIKLYKSGIDGYIGSFEHFSYEASKLCSDNENFINVVTKIAGFNEVSGAYSIKTVLALNNVSYYYGVATMEVVYAPEYDVEQFVFSGVLADSTGTIKLVTQGDTFSSISGVYTAVDTVYEI